MVNYVTLAATAKRLIEANGRTVTLYKQDRAPANPAQPWRGNDAVPTPPDGRVLTVKVAFIPAGGSADDFGRTLGFSGAEIRKLKIEQVGLLAVDSVTAHVPAVPIVEVENMDTLVDDSKVLAVVKVGHLKPGDTSLIFLLGLSG